jgi:hypothetical protein
MPWDKNRIPAERSDGSTGKISDVWTKVKTDRSGRPSDLLVGPKGQDKHDHYYNLNTSGPDGRKSKNTPHWP